MSGRRKLVIVGAGGLGVEAHWVASAMPNGDSGGWDILGFADDGPDRVGGDHYGVPILCRSSEIAAVCGNDAHVYLAIGDNRVRQRIAYDIEIQGLQPATLIHPRAEQADGVMLGDGCYVGPFATLAPQCRIGRYVIINIRAVVGHETVIADFSQLAPGAVLTGGCILDEGAFVGANASLFPQRKMGEFSTVASNSFAVADVPAGETVVGVPARAVYRRR